MNSQNCINKFIGSLDLQLVSKKWLINLMNELENKRDLLQELQNTIDLISSRLEKYEHFNTSCASAMAKSQTPVYIDDSFQLSLKPVGKLNNSCVIISVPKSGTYLAAKLLEKIGFIDLEFHVSDKYCADYRWLDLYKKREHSLAVIKQIEFKYIAMLLRPGQFCVGHLPYSEYNYSLLINVKKLFLIRDIRDCIVSYMRFCQNKKISSEKEWDTIADPRVRLQYFLEKSDLASYFFEMAKSVVGWLKDENALIIRYENMIACIEQTLFNICRHCEVEISEEKIRSLSEESIKEDNVTFTGKYKERSNYEKYWSYNTDKLFTQLGGYNLNNKFGYF